MSNLFNPQASQSQGHVNGDTESKAGSLQPGISMLEVTVLRVNNLPRRINPFSKKRNFYVTLTDGKTIKKTTAMRGENRAVEWDEKLDAFEILPSSRVLLSLYSERSKHEDQIIGTLDMPLESKTNLSLVLSNLNNMNSSTFLDAQVEAERAVHNMDTAMQTMNCYETWENALGRIQWVMDSLSSISEVHACAKIAFSLLSVIPKTFLTQVQLDVNIKALLVAIHDGFDFVQDASVLQNLKPQSKQTNILILMLGHVGNCCDFIQSYARDKSFWVRILKHAGGQGDKQISDLCSTFVKLRKSFLEHANLTTELIVFQIMDDLGVLSAQISGISTMLDNMSSQLLSKISDLDLEQKIGEIPYRTRWRYDIKTDYIPGTRTDFLDYIARWVANPDSKRGLVLFGQAGTGKSSIAQEIARRFQAMNRLTSYFTFLRAEQRKREDYHLFTTIVHDLSQRYPSFKIALGKVIRDNKSLRTAQHYRLLFESMILRPLEDVQLVGPVFIIIDGLDESGDVLGQEGLHRFLVEHLVQLPANFRVLITSRPEPDIVEQFTQFKTAFDIVLMDDPDLSASTDKDIYLYLQTKLPRNTFEKYGDELAKKTEGLFQWVAVACGYINSPPRGLTRDQCVRGLLADHADLVGLHQVLGPLNSLYKQVLEGYLESDFVLRQFQSVIGPLLAAFEPLSIDSLATLSQYSVGEEDVEDSVVAIASPLGSLLSNVTSTDRTLPIIPLHTSFRDFLTNQQLSGPFYIDLGEAHHQLAQSSLALMLENLKFNICELPSSYYPNNKIDDLQPRADSHISSALFYACRFWEDHLERVTPRDELLHQVRTLLETNFLFWLEVLSLKNLVALATPALSSLVRWLALGQHSEGCRDDIKALQEFVIDAATFVRYFGMAIAKSASHIYVSALPFMPTSSLISRKYSPLFPNTLKLLTLGQLSHWPGAEVNISCQSSCLSVAFSPDGQQIISGLGDGTICVWNATTGQMEGRPFTGHTGSVNSVAFSSDGRRIVSGSDDCTIRVWNSMKGQTEGNPFTGHSGSVSSVAFSLDGQRIVSGSYDFTIRVWNVEKGHLEGSPFCGHSGLVYSVGFSPNGKQIVSGSHDHTIRVWNATTGQMEGDPFTGHTDCVRSVAFSPDGRRIVSGSNDSTIRLWNVTTGQMEEGSPFMGHTDWVKSVAFSPDGQWIVSGSNDRTICVWNAMTGKIEGGPFVGHTDKIAVVGFSPDGQRIVSGAIDRTIQMWNAKTMGSPFIGHTDSLNSVAFTPDGQWIVSGSNDSTIRVWNATTGKLEGGPFTGHTDSVNSVNFSLDGQWIVSGSDDRTIRVWNIRTRKMEGSPITGHTGWVKSVAFSPDGQWIVSGSHDRTIRVWSAKTGKIEGNPFTGHSGSVNSVRFSPDGQRIASGSNDGTIRVWNATTGQIEGNLSMGHNVWVNSVGFSLGGQQIVSGSDDGVIRLLNAKTGHTEGDPFTGHTGSVSSVAFSPDGQRIVSGSDDGTIRVWNATTGQMECSPFTGHTGSFNSVAFSPDGQQIVSGSDDGIVRLWNISTLSNNTAEGFHDSSRVETDGWIHGKSGELLLWVPSIHRRCLHRPSNVWIAGPNETRLDLSHFLYGGQWAACYKSS